MDDPWDCSEPASFGEMAAIEWAEPHVVWDAAYAWVDESCVTWSEDAWGRAALRAAFSMTLRRRCGVRGDLAGFAYVPGRVVTGGRDRAPPHRAPSASSREDRDTVQAPATSAM